MYVMFKVDVMASRARHTEITTFLGIKPFESNATEHVRVFQRGIQIPSVYIFSHTIRCIYQLSVSDVIWSLSVARFPPSTAITTTIVIIITISILFVALFGFVSIQFFVFWLKHSPKTAPLWNVSRFSKLLEHSENKVMPVCCFRMFA